MTIPLLLLTPLIICLLVAALWDLASYTIPNPIQLALIISFATFAFAISMSWEMLGWHMLAGMLGLSIGFALFAFGVIGGGDAKLFACTALWLGLHDLPGYVLVTVMLGGGLSMALLMFRKLPLPSVLVRHNWVLRLHNPQQGVPYGVALAAGLLLILPQTELFAYAMA